MSYISRTRAPHTTCRLPDILTERTYLEVLLRRDRLVVGLSLICVVGLAAGYIFQGAGMEMSALQMTKPMRHMGAGQYTPWTASYGITMFLMWWVMMIAMMLPSASPTILLAAALNRRSRADTSPYGSTAMFCIGYLLAWALFSLAAVAAQWWLESNNHLSMHLETLGSSLTGGLLIVAGLWQLTPLKAACLRHCRSPAEFLVHNRRPGTMGPLYMGAHHGAYCLGCCWFLMGLLFVGGVMNLYWIIGLAVYVFLEKVMPMGPLLGRIAGLTLMAVGVWVVVANLR